MINLRKIDIDDLVIRVDNTPVGICESVTINADLSGSVTLCTGETISGQISLYENVRNLEGVV